MSAVISFQLMSYFLPKETIGYIGPIRHIGIT